MLTRRTWTKAKRTVPFYGLLALFLIIVLLPIYYIFLTAFAPSEKLFTQPLSYLPQSLELTRFKTVFAGLPIGRYMLNTAVLATSSTLLALFFSFLAAYAIARMQFPGAGLVMAIETAMGMAGLHPHDTQAFCAHGTGTLFNDSMELAAIEAVFGDRRFPVFSIKGAVGHTLGAAGGIDAAICAHALAHKLIPPTVGLQTPESKAAGRVSHQAQAFDGRNILTSNSGFGGVNAALVLHAVPT